MRKIPSFSELLENTISSQDAAERERDLAVEQEIIARQKQQELLHQEAERLRSEENERMLAHIAAQEELQGILQDDAQHAAALLTERQIHPDICIGGVVKKMTRFRLFGKSEYMTIDNRRPIGWLAALSVRMETYQSGTIWHEGTSGGGYAEFNESGRDEPIMETRYKVRPLILSVNQGLVTTSRVLEFNRIKLQKDDVYSQLNSGHYAFAPVDVQKDICKSPIFGINYDVMLGLDGDIDPMKVGHFSRESASAPQFDFESTRVSLVKLVLGNM